MARMMGQFSGLGMERDQYSAPTPGFMSVLSDGLKERRKEAALEAERVRRAGLEEREMGIREAGEKRNVAAEEVKKAERRKAAIELAREAMSNGDHGSAQMILSEAGIDGEAMRGTPDADLMAPKRNPFAGDVRDPGMRSRSEPEAPTDGPGSEMHDGDADADDPPASPYKAPRGGAIEDVGTNYQQDLEGQAEGLQRKIEASAVTPEMLREPKPLAKDNATGLYGLLRVKHPTGGTIDIDPYAQRNQARDERARQAQAYGGALPPEVKPAVAPMLGAHEEGAPGAMGAAYNATIAGSAAIERDRLADEARAATAERARLDREQRERGSIRMANRPRAGLAAAGTEHGTTADLKAIAAEESRYKTDPNLNKLATEYNRVRGTIDKLQAAYDTKDPTTRGPAIGENLQLTLGALTQGDVGTFITSSQPGFANLIERVKKELGVGSGLISDATLKEFLNGYKNVVLPWLSKRRDEEISKVASAAASHVMPGVRNRSGIIRKDVAGMFGEGDAAPKKKTERPRAAISAARARVMAEVPPGPERDAILAEIGE